MSDTAIARAAHYDTTVDALVDSRAVQAMARQLPATAAEVAVWVDRAGGKAGFMNRANAEYHARTVTAQRPGQMHLGAVVEAIARIRPDLAEVIVP